ncbi:MAG: IS3 family transposase, partial [Bacillus sp. (in: firmicutes)]
LIDDALKTFNIQRSLSMKGCPYDNAVAEATFKIIKTEFVRGQPFDSLEELTRELHDYVHWFNHIRIHGTLGYISPIDYKLEHLKKVVKFSVDIPMSRRGNCWDNAPQESFFGHFKDEAYIKPCNTLEELRREIKNYMTYYNNFRYQWNLKKMTPVQYRTHLLHVA